MPWTRSTSRLIAFVVLSVALARPGDAQEAPLADHHQHLFSPAVVTFMNLDTGRSFRYGETNADVLRRSFQS